MVILDGPGSCVSFLRLLCSEFPLEPIVPFAVNPKHILTSLILVRDCSCYVVAPLMHCLSYLAFLDDRLPLCFPKACNGGLVRRLVTTPISRSGFTVGWIDGINGYLSAMVAELASHQQCTQNGSDQARRPSSLSYKMYQFLQQRALVCMYFSLSHACIRHIRAVVI